MKPATFSSIQNSSLNNGMTIAFWLILLVIGFIISIIKSAKHNHEIDVWENKSKSKAILFAFLFGPFGAHRFYLNRNKSALIQLFGTITLFVSTFCLDFSSTIGTLCILFSLATQLWNKLDIFLILFNGLVPLIEDKAVNAPPCEADGFATNDTTLKEMGADLMLNKSVDENTIKITEKNDESEMSDGNGTETLVNKVNGEQKNKEVTIIRSEVDNAKYIKLLKDIDILHKEGILTDEEYQQKKTEILSRI